MKFEIENSFPTAVEETVGLIQDAQQQQEIYADLGYEAWEEEERIEEEDGTVKRTLRVVPKIDLPGFVKSALGNSSEYREYQEWAPDGRSYTWEVEMEISSLVDLHGECRFEDAEDGCVRTISAECKVSIPFVGGAIASYVKDETVRTQTESASALAKILAG